MAKKKKTYELEDETLNQISELRTYFNVSFNETIARIVSHSYKSMQENLTMEEASNTRDLVQQLFFELGKLKVELKEKDKNNETEKKAIIEKLKTQNERLNRHSEKIEANKKSFDEEIEGIKTENGKGFLKKLTGKQ